MYEAWFGLLATDPWPEVFTVTVYWIGVKETVTVLSPLIVMVVGFVDPERSPLHPEKLHPADGVVVIWTVDPEAYDAWLEFSETVPWPTVETVSVYMIWVKTASIVWAIFMITVIGFSEPASTPSNCQ